MAKSKSKKRAAADVKGRIPEAIQYEALKSMSRTPSTRDLKKRARKSENVRLKKGDWKGEYA